MYDVPDGGPGLEGRDRLERLCSSCVAGVGADGGGVSVLSTEGLAVMVHATDAVSSFIEDLQFTLGEGPCVEASAPRARPSWSRT